MHCIMQTTTISVPRQWFRPTPGYHWLWLLDDHQLLLYIVLSDNWANMYATSTYYNPIQLSRSLELNL